MSTEQNLATLFTTSRSTVGSRRKTKRGWLRKQPKTKDRSSGLRESNRLWSVLYAALAEAAERITQLRA